MTRASGPRERFLQALNGSGDLPSPPLVQLAEKLGVTTEYIDWKGQTARVSADTLRAVVKALGFPAETTEQAKAGLEEADDLAWQRAIEPSTVIRQGTSARVSVTLPEGQSAAVWIDLDDDPLLGGTGQRVELDQLSANHGQRRTINGHVLVRQELELPADLPLGWHQIKIRPFGGALAVGTLVVCPDKLELPGPLRAHAVWGAMVQLYSVRSHQSWGTGDFEDLANLADLIAKQGGADFIMINPIHAAEPLAPFEPSPYRPATREFTNPFYIRPETIAEYATAPAAIRAQVDALAREAQQANSSAAELDRDTSWTLKRQALDALYQAPRSPARQADLDAYRAAHQPAIGDFALWSALKDQDLAEQIAYGSPQAAQFAAEHPDAVEFHIWLQWIAAQQLAAAQARCKDAGMAVGLVKDLAVGVHPNGADGWSRQGVLAPGIEVGAPPDYFNQVGQSWSQPPWRPDALAETGYSAYRSMLRAVLASAGALRMDHILGLTRLWWIPQGMGPAAGTYVTYDQEAMVSILVLEAQRAGAVVIGEDLGVIPPGLREYLGSRGLLGNSIVWFEKAEDGTSLLEPERYRRLAMTAITSHDLPPTAAYLTGEHINQREQMGLLDTPPAQAKDAARHERAQMVELLLDRGLIDPAHQDDVTEVVKAMHRLLRQVPSVMLGVSLADMVGERRTQNLPGTDREYPNWSVPLADAEGQPVLIEDLDLNPVFRGITEVMRGSR